ncbi:MAG TPA: DinB family protein [Candidatus Dormibacteraeota bacterium]|nr:DinB family protein [Candidatus Dormibacteraeota bacterium]
MSRAERSATSLLAHHFKLGHAATLALVDELSEDQFRWRPASGPQSIGWNLWHIAKWDDFMAEALMARTPSLSQLGPAHQIWDLHGVASQWGWETGRLGVLEGGTGLPDDDAAALKLPAKRDVVSYATEAFAHLENVVSELDDSLLHKVVPGSIIYPNDPKPDTYGNYLVPWLNHGYEHLGTMEALKGLLGMRGAVDL